MLRWYELLKNPESSVDKHNRSLWSSICSGRWALTCRVFRSSFSAIPACGSCHSHNTTIKPSRQEAESGSRGRIWLLLLSAHWSVYHDVAICHWKGVSEMYSLCEEEKPKTLWAVLANDHHSSAVVRAVGGGSNNNKKCERNDMWDHLWGIDLNSWKEKSCSWKNRSNVGKNLELGKITMFGECWIWEVVEWKRNKNFKDKYFYLCFFWKRLSIHFRTPIYFPRQWILVRNYADNYIVRRN